MNISRQLTLAAAIFLCMPFFSCEKVKDIDSRDAFVGLYDVTEIARYSNNPSPVIFNYVLTINKTNIIGELVLSGNLSNLQTGNNCNALFYATADSRTPEKLTFDAGRLVVCTNNQRIIFAGSGTLQNNNRTLVLNTGATFANGFSNNVNSTVTCTKR
jgi:hypothetical protein